MSDSSSRSPFYHEPGLPQEPLETRFTTSPGIVTDSLFEVTDKAGIEAFKARMNGKYRAVAERHYQAIVDAPDPLLLFCELIERDFVVNTRFTGEDRIPQTGPVIIAGNHQFAFVDMVMLINHIMKQRQGRPWAMVGNAKTFSTLFPNWEANNRIAEHYIAVQRESIQGSSRIQNGREVVSRASAFLTKAGNPILFMAPEGSDAIYQKHIGVPHKGLAIIAKETNAQIVPVVVSGSVDKDQLMFDVRADITDAYHAYPNNQDTLDEWTSRFSEHHTETALGFEAGLQRTVSDIQQLLRSSGTALIDIEGRVGAGKTTFTQQLVAQLDKLGVSVAVVSKDKYVIAPGEPDLVSHRLEEVEAHIDQLRSTTAVVVIEGLIPHGSMQIRRRFNYKIFITASPDERLRRKILRNVAQGKQTIKESLDMIVRLASSRQGYLDKYEGRQPDSNTNIIIENDYVQPGSPRLTIIDNALVFMLDGKIVDQVKLDDAGDTAKAIKSRGLIS